MISSIIIGMGKKYCPSVFAPTALQGLPPSWSGIFGRIVNPPRSVDHPQLGKYTYTQLSRDEDQRVCAHNFQKIINQFPPGSYNLIHTDDEPVGNKK